uniref:Uncharacterized protein n=1 Tax=Chlamydomonas leiostraca TaxID=1034604 RepID=A0A7S0S318_9CHLO|mmetsp:Transcript_37483/g.94615  ORF Transcript_37483/g.94615 Transcript_37483/m.94615 type:complete len:389 (+) Transcript_37483:91-1257(+)|eukprot:CAMPEP_0202876032 /NCGR_PEP_ID=MMETSP1391-20130828/28363_1 /ASSEMBLY_ACC=CAM_ASM_000867 /TAXON_ID=1034604 /ORGANISM="Chlamydomonas leiostraca, Strain SAG 11-49" /LENGTH=388 /DNA_ID=CAMNT_0049557807 /DNA_START=52 /DNA_END=1218 /DNA_ORIENTATION=-
MDRANQAFVEEEYEQAVELYTEALKTDPNNAKIYECRSHAHIKLENYLEAAEDAAKAIELDPTMGKAYLRRGMACFHLEEYEAAKQAFEAGAKQAPDMTQFKTWIRKCQAEIDDAQEQDTAPPAKQPTPAKEPAASTATPKAAPPPPPTPSAPAPAPATTSEPQPAAADAAQQPITKAAPSEFVGKYRHQWYQLQNKVTVDVYAKNLKKEQVEVSFGEQHLCIVIRAEGSGEEEYRLEADLYGKVDTGACRWEVLKTKVEVTMTKATTLQWGSLERSAAVAAPNYSNPAQEPVGGKYPSSHVKAPKDWSKVEAEVKELEQKGELEDGDPLNAFFKKIFAQGDEDQRRAMMKSFVESNGTVLSTNWNEVGAKKVECTPPDGMVAKKWES